MIHHTSLTHSILGLIKKGEAKFAGNLKLNIYGTLRCSSGKRMKKENRVFFKNEAEAIHFGFRPCKRCMHPDDLSLT